jgi:TRAP-type C4-dicarboxylate transport system permease small subunit
LLTAGINPISKGITLIATFVLFLMMMLTAVDVILRYFFDRPITGSYEITSFMMVIVMGCALGLCQMDRGHITVDIVTQFLPRRLVSALNVFHDLASLVLLALMTWQTFVHFGTLLKANTLSVAIPIPHWPFAFILGLGLVFYWLVYLRDWLTDTSRTFGGTQ